MSSGIYKDIMFVTHASVISKTLLCNMYVPTRHELFDRSILYIIQCSEGQSSEDLCLKASSRI